MPPSMACVYCRSTTGNADAVDRIIAAVAICLALFAMTQCVKARGDVCERGAKLEAQIAASGLGETLAFFIDFQRGEDDADWPALRQSMISQGMGMTPMEADAYADMARTLHLYGRDCF